MEISSVLSTARFHFHHHIRTHTLTSSCPIIPSLSPSSTPRTTFTSLTSATSTSATPFKEPNLTHSHSNSYLRRQSALRQVQQSPDLNSSLQQFGGILKPQDFGKLGKWHHPSQGLFQTAVSRYIAEPEKKELLLQLLQWMPGQGYVVDSMTRNLILKNSELFGRQFTAELLSKQHIMSKSSPSRR